VVGKESRDADENGLHVGVVAIQRGSRYACCLRESGHRQPHAPTFDEQGHGSLRDALPLPSPVRLRQIRPLRGTR